MLKTALFDEIATVKFCPETDGFDNTKPAPPPALDMFTFDVDVIDGLILKILDPLFCRSIKRLVFWDAEFVTFNRNPVFDKLALFHVCAKSMIGVTVVPVTDGAV
jgi:hypothetical protein